MVRVITNADQALPLSKNQQIGPHSKDQSPTTLSNVTVNCLGNVTKLTLAARRLPKPVQ